MSTIWLINGPTGAGKTSVSLALCRRYPKALHIPIDDLREWVRSGYASPIDAGADPAEVRRQFTLARRAASATALEYSAAGFAAIVDDVIGTFAREAYDPLVHAGARRVLLLPSLAVALERNRTRTNKAFDTAILDPVTRDLHGMFERERADVDGWTVIDSSVLTLEQTVDAIIERCGL